MPTNKQRREAARRHLERQLQRREEREAARKRFTLIASIVGTIVLIALVTVFIVVINSEGNKTKHKPAAASVTPTTSATPTTSTPPVAKYPCTWTKAPNAARPVSIPATTKPPKKGTVVVNVATNRGAMTFTLDRAQAPCTVASFVSLVQQKFFDKTPCPRVESKNLFILQCGDPTGTTSGGPGYTIPDEYTGKEKYTAGVLAMANSGSPNSGGSQFFIVYKPDQLPPSYTIFGKVTSGLSVVTKVAAAGDDGSNSAGGGKPKLPITFVKLTVVQ